MAISRDLKVDILRYLPSWFLYIRNFVRKLKDNPLPLSDTIRAFRMGFYPSSFIAYGLEKGHSKDYLSSLANQKIRNVNGKRALILNDKLLFERLMGDIVEIPTNLGLILRGSVIPLDATRKLASSTDILEYCSACKSKLILKPLNSSGGHGLFLVQIKGDMVQVNNDKMGVEKFNNLISPLDNYIITKYVEQSSFMSEIFPYAVNTVRILTMVDPTTHEPFVANAVLRIGTNKSIPTDNMSRGGLSAFIDLKTGVLGKAAMFPQHSNQKDRVVWHDKHPDTGKQISGLQIPNWQGSLKAILKAASRIPYIPYVGWDVCIFEKKVVVLEGNSRPGPTLFQMHGPLLKNERVRRFYKYYNAI